MQVLPPPLRLLPVTRDAPGTRNPSTLKVQGAKKILSGELNEEAYVRALANELLGQSEEFYKLLGGGQDWTDRLGQTQKMSRADIYKAYMLASTMNTAADARARGVRQLTRLPPRMFAFSQRDADLAGQVASSAFRPRPDAEIYELLASTPKTGPLELIKTARIPFVDVDTPSTGRFKEVHPKSGITASSKAEALDILQQLSNQLGSTLRAYVSPGGLRAFDVSRERNPMDFYRAVGGRLLKKLDPNYVAGSQREGWFTPVGRAVRRWDPKTKSYYPFSLENVYDFPGFPVRTGPKFNRNPLDDYIAASIGNITPQGTKVGQGTINPAMLETVLQMHDVRAAANRTPQSRSAMMGDLKELIDQGIKGPTLEFIKKNYRLLVALGLLPAAAMGVNTPNGTDQRSAA